MLIEYYPVKKNRKDINVLYVDYNIEPLKTRRKRNMLNIMYDQSLDSSNIYTNNCNIELRSSKKVKLKSTFTRLAKVKKSPLYRGLDLWNQLSVQLQTELSKLKFKREIKNYVFC